MQDSLKRKLLAGGIAGALVLGAGAVAGAATGAGPFDNGTREIGQHNVTDVEHGTEFGDETTTTSLGTDPTVAPPVSDDAPGHDANDDNGVDAPGHDANDGPGHDVGDDNSGPGSDNSGPGSDNSGPGSDNSGHGEG
ncbi:MAG: hypothetical protein MUP67_02940 [Acidimicrobiia bacterium]|nr:hypothetical protein [Acidimicrobiia bacterium]